MLVLNGTTGVSAVQDDAVNPVTDIASGIPCFSAYQSVAQTSTAGTFFKVNFQTKEFDTTTAFDNVTNMRFQPQVAGYYQVNCGIGTDVNASLLSLYKNGVANKTLSAIYLGNTYGAYGSIIIYCNGTTDYIEVYAQTSISQSLVAESKATYFQAHLIVGA